MAKGRTPLLESFKFNKLMPEDIEESVETYLSSLDKGFCETRLYPVFDQIYDFYSERNDHSDALSEYFLYSKKEFREILRSFTESYVGYQEVNYYFYLKYLIDEVFECHDKNRYFNDREEIAIREYIKSSDQERREILYMRFLKYPFEKLVESIINKYQLYSETNEFDELLLDTVSFLHFKLDRFDPDRGTKAYSYLGTIAKHHLQSIKIKEHKNKIRNQSYEETQNEFIDNRKYAYRDPLEAESFLETFVEDTPALIEEFIRTSTLKKEESEIGYAILDIMRDWGDLGEVSNKMNKNMVFEFIRNITGLSTKDIRNGLKPFKVFYEEKKKEVLREHYDPMNFI